ncbi:uncharacterized protein LOC142337040 [Convolutriloba macropyga]|uniref:uncharacterized protein LOC142337040 n=1 Tax=Convolutriloba macropyga TaxID=536237 RepID=UPI003F520B0A
MVVAIVGTTFACLAFVMFIVLFCPIEKCNEKCISLYSDNNANASTPELDATMAMHILAFIFNIGSILIWGVQLGGAWVGYDAMAVRITFNTLAWMCCSVLASLMTSYGYKDEYFVFIGISWTAWVGTFASFVCSVL